MKHLITFLFALVTSSAWAQYPLPDTRVYGNLIVDSSFVNEFQGLTLMNDTVSIGPFNIPFSGTGSPYANGLFVDGTGDFTAFGQAPRQATIGYLSAGNTQRLLIDTNQVAIYSDSVAKVFATDEVYLAANKDRWELGFTAFSTSSNVETSATMYALLNSNMVDVNVVKVDTLHSEIQSHYSIVSIGNSNVNRLYIDSTKAELTYGLAVGTPITPTNRVDFTVNTTGVDISTTTGAFYPPRMTSTQASALSPGAGAIVYVTDTNGTFTSIGIWAYENGSWTKL